VESDGGYGESSERVTRKRGAWLGGSNQVSTLGRSHQKKREWRRCGISAAINRVGVTLSRKKGGNEEE